MNTIQKIQGIMDEHKQSLPENVYLQLCNEMKELHTEVKDLEICDVEGIYEIEYEVVSCVPDRTNNVFNLKVEHRERKIELNEEEYQMMTEAELNHSFITSKHHCADIIRKIEPLYQHVWVRPLHDEIKELDFDEILPAHCEDIEDGIRGLSIHLGFHKTINIIGLKKY